ncbi:MAG: peptide chain release factor N(5)-glutamine methyltransferase [Hyphomicrobiales bacterium]|nr:peptide chain release factor N(5)-glutamine methyltransferase [Hyphomicrobiales bacterium]
MPEQMSESMTLAQLEAWGCDQLRMAGLSAIHHDVKLLLMAAAGLDKAGLISASQKETSADLADRFAAFIQRRMDREPVHRILGRREFHGLELGLNAATLEPRDDTECLIELALAQVKERNAELRLLDLGTGTGAVALALLQELPNAQAVASDLQPAALQRAQANAELNGLSARFSSLQSNWFENVIGQFDLIVSNPPYIVSAELENLEPEVVRFDPRLALDGGADGLDAYREILAGAREYLVPNGCVVLEIGYDQRQLVSELAVASGWKVKQSAEDLAGQDRALCLV